MKKIIKTELIYYIIILVLLSLAIHPDLVTSPLERIDIMQTRGNYMHPLLWSFGFYLLVAVIRASIYGVNILKKRLNKEN